MNNEHVYSPKTDITNTQNTM